MNLTELINQTEAGPKVVDSVSKRTNSYNDGSKQLTISVTKKNYPDMNSAIKAIEQLRAEYESYEPTWESITSQTDSKSWMVEFDANKKEAAPNA